MMVITMMIVTWLLWKWPSSDGLNVSGQHRFKILGCHNSKMLDVVMGYR